VARDRPDILAWSYIIRVFLFENVKYFIEGMFVEAREGFLVAIHGIMVTIPIET
jgi:hypothetical protein